MDSGLIVFVKHDVHHSHLTTVTDGERASCHFRQDILNTLGCSFNAHGEGICLCVIDRWRTIDLNFLKTSQWAGFRYPLLTETRLRCPD